MNIWTVSALCASGKTYSAVRWAAPAASASFKIAIIQPSHNLLAQTEREFANLNGAKPPRVTRIDATTHPGQVHRSTMAHLNETPPSQGEVLLVTQQSFLALPYWHRRSQWTVVIDELPQVDFSFCFNLPDNHKLLTQHLTICPHDLRHYRVGLRRGSAAAMRYIAQNRSGDDVNEMFREFATLLLNRHVAVFVDRQGWNRTLAGDDGRHALLFACFLEPSVFDGFEQVILMGAHLEHSVLHHAWSDRVAFRPFKPIKPRFTSHDGASVDIYYPSDRDWSKKLRDQIDGVGPVLAAIKRTIGDEPVLVAVNKDVDFSVVTAQLPNATRLPNVPHGLREFQHIDDVIFLTALNSHPWHYRLAEEFFAVDGDTMRNARTHEAIYQAAMRCSLRDLSNSARKRIFVPDLKAAEWLSPIFTGSTVRKLETGIIALDRPAAKRGAPRKAQVLTPAQRKAKGKLRSDALLNQLAELRGKLEQGLFVTGEVQLFASRYSETGEPAKVISNDDLIAQLHRCWLDVAPPKKEQNALLSPSMFDDELVADSSRGLANIVYVNGFWLDQDGGDLGVEEFRRYFPSYRFVAFNSYTPGNTRYFFPTTDLMTVDVYHHIFDGFIHVLRQGSWISGKEKTELGERGSNYRSHGIDMSKRCASSLFYVPTQCSEPSQSFWREFCGVDLDPFAWLDRDPLPAPKEFAVTASPRADCLAGTDGSDRAHARERPALFAIAKYKALSPTQPGGRYEDWKRLAARLWYLGYEGFDLESKLREADWDGYRAKKRQIRDIMRMCAKIVRPRCSPR